jgi:hypothetical protein
MLLPLLLLVTAFIVYGSLYPWQFHAAQIAGNPLMILLHSWGFSVNRYFVSDTGVNIALYLPFGATCYLWLERRAGWIKIGATLLLALLLSSSLEMIQLFDAKRVCSILDVITNVTGTACGIAVASRFHASVKIRPLAAAPLFLLACWVAAMLFPFMPDISTRHFVFKLATFTSPPFSASGFFVASVTWLVAARMVEASFRRGLYPLLLAILPMRLLVSGITLSWTDCAPALLALGIWFAWPAGHRRRDATLAGLSLAAILAAGLVPFHFSAVAQPFSWIPFRALFSSDWETGFAIFFRKCFAYGSAIWLLAAAGWSLAVSSAAVASVLAGLEFAQLWLPNHVAESTDPLHALILGWVIHRLEAGTKWKRNASVRL